MFHASLIKKKPEYRSKPDQEERQRHVLSILDYIFSGKRRGLIFTGLARSRIHNTNFKQFFRYLGMKPPSVCHSSSTSSILQHPVSTVQAHVVKELLALFSADVSGQRGCQLPRLRLYMPPWCQHISETPLLGADRRARLTHGKLLQARRICQWPHQPHEESPDSHTPDGLFVCTISWPAFKNSSPPLTSICNNKHKGDTQTSL